MPSHVRAASCLLKTPMSKSLGILAFMAGDHKTFSREQARRKHEKAEKEIEKEIRRRPVQAEMGRIVEKKLSTKKGQFKLQLYPFGPRQQAHANVNAREREKSRSKSKSKLHSSHYRHSSHSRPSEHAAWKQHPPDRPHKSSGRDADRGRYRTRHHVESASDLASVLSSTHFSDEDYEGHDGSYYDDDGDAHEEYPHTPHTPPQGPARIFLCHHLGSMLVTLLSITRNSLLLTGNLFPPRSHRHGRRRWDRRCNRERDRGLDNRWDNRWDNRLWDNRLWDHRLWEW